jgi:hypothetical protein
MPAGDRQVARLLLTLLALAWPAQSRATDIDLVRAVVVAPASLSRQEVKAVQMLIEEVAKRTRIRWLSGAQWPADGTPVIAVGPTSTLHAIAGPIVEQLADWKGVDGAEGYRIRVYKEGRPAPAVFVVGNDARGVLFGVGRLLRELKMARDRVSLPGDFEATSVPRYPLRGHQLGYRPKTNSYDGWDLVLWEQYIRDLAVFGTNAVELIPPRSDDDADSPHTGWTRGSGTQPWTAITPTPRRWSLPSRSGATFFGNCRASTPFLCPAAIPVTPNPGTCSRCWRSSRGI